MFAFLTLTLKVYCKNVWTGKPAGHFLIVPLMSFAVSKMEECDRNKGGEVVRGQTEKKYTLAKIGAQIETSTVLKYMLKKH